MGSMANRGGKALFFLTLWGLSMRTLSIRAFSLTQQQGRRNLWQTTRSTRTTTTTTTVTTRTTRSFAASARHQQKSLVVDNDQETPNKKVIQDALYRIRQVNHMPPDIRQSLIPFQIDGVTLGKVRPSMADLLIQTGPNVFELTPNNKNSTETTTTDDNDDATSTTTTTTTLSLTADCGSSRDERSQAVASVMEKLRDQGVVRGWRNELYPVAPTFTAGVADPVFVMERAAVPVLGVLEYGVHINGLVKKRNDDDDDDDDDAGKDKDQNGLVDEIMWMARRSATKSKFPGMLDHLVAGGQPVGISLVDNAIKECLEEAGIPPDVSRAGLIPVGAISYESYQPRSETIARTVLFNFDLHLPADFIPTPVDGEVQEFFLWTVQDIVDSLAPDYPDPIKPNCYVVIIDWLLRQGHLSPDVPGYLDVLKELRSGDCQ